MRLKFNDDSPKYEVCKSNNLKVTTRFEALVELSRKAEGLIPRSELSNLFPKLALGVHTRDDLEKLSY